MKMLRPLLLALALALLVYGLLRERHQVHSLAGGEPDAVSGPGFTRIATYDGLMLKEGRLYDISTASSAAGEDGNEAPPTECPT